jgi:hypothetical protein
MINIPPKDLELVNAIIKFLKDFNNGEETQINLHKLGIMDNSYMKLTDKGFYITEKYKDYINNKANEK